MKIQKIFFAFALASTAALASLPETLRCKLYRMTSDENSHDVLLQEGSLKPNGALDDDRRFILKGEFKNEQNVKYQYRVSVFAMPPYGPVYGDIQVGTLKQDGKVSHYTSSQFKSPGSPLEALHEHDLRQSSTIDNYLESWATIKLICK